MTNEYKRKRNLFDPASDKPFRISRSKIELFMRCPRCFYLDRRLGIAQPSGPPFNLNSAVDALLKREFDVCRAQKAPHPLMIEAGVDAIPFQHEKLDEWRDSLRRGVVFQLLNSPIVITGGIDDVWVAPSRALHVVDYKATSKNGEVSLDGEWQVSYKRQVEIYQWLFRRNGFDVSDTAYFVYCNGNAAEERFDACLKFKIKIIPHVGSDNWVPGTLEQLVACLRGNELPPPAETCEFCAYRRAAADVE